MSKITALRTLRIAERPNLVWLELETDDGLTGLGPSIRMEIKPRYRNVTNECLR